MIGLSILGALLLVTVLTIWIFIAVIKRAKRKSKNPFLHGFVAAIVLFFLITWDWIPSEIYYNYQCKQLPPMQVYKTPEQWIAENQDLIKGGKVEFKIKSEQDLPQVSVEGFELISSWTSLDNFFAYAVYSSEKNNVFRNHYVKGMIFDKKTGNVLIEKISLHHLIRFYSRPMWIGGKSCLYDHNDQKRFMKLENTFKKLDTPLSEKEVLK